MRQGGGRFVNKINPRTLLKALALFVAFFVANEAAYAFSMPFAIFPVAAAVALVGLFFGGLEIAPAIFLAAITSYLMHGAPIFIGTILAAGNTLQALVGAYVLRRFRLDPLLRRVRDMFILIIVAVTASMIVPTVGIFAYDLSIWLGLGGNSVSWGTRWAGHLLSLLIVGPFLIRWFAKPTFSRTPAQWVETVAAFAFLATTDYFIFWTQTAQFRGITLAYALLVAFFWISIRLGPRFMTLAFFGTTFAALFGAVLGPHAVGVTPEAIGTRLFQTQLFLEVIAILFFILNAIETERRFAADALREQVRRLEDALRRISSEDRAKGEFLAVLGHELRNPLAPITSALELLRMKGTSAVESHRLIEMMMGRVRTMSRLLDDLLDISRISRRKLKLQKTKVDVCELTRRSVQAVNELTIEKTHSFDVSIPQKEIFVEGDPVRLEQMLINLLKNSVKYTPKGGHISLSLNEKPNTVVIRVKDNGIGIEPNMLSRIFDPFVQDESVKMVQGGTGLGIGLSLTRMLAELHGGTVEAKSDGKGKGSEFTVCLPILPGETQEAVALIPAKAGAGKEEKKRRKNVLIVDDNEAAADGLATLLEYKGYNVHKAYAGLEALAQVKKVNPDAVLLDIGLPDMGGYEVAGVLRAAERYNGTLIALTGYGQDDDKEKAFASGFDHHLTKPVSLSDIEDILVNVRARR